MTRRKEKRVRWKTGSNGKVTVEQGADGEKKFRMSQKHESHRRLGIAAG